MFILCLDLRILYWQNTKLSYLSMVVSGTVTQDADILSYLKPEKTGGLKKSIKTLNGIIGQTKRSEVQAGML